MSENKEAGLNDVDMQAVFATWIIANNGCGYLSRIDCAGEKGLFKGTECPLWVQGRGCVSGNSIIRSIESWLSRYHYRKAKAAEAGKLESEAAKKEEQEAKRTCGECQHIYDADGSIEIGTTGITLCHKKSIRVPIEFAGCCDFEHMVKARRNDKDGCYVDGILISEPSQEDKLRHKVWLLELENSHRLNDIERLKAEEAKRTTDNAERIAQLEKDVEFNREAARKSKRVLGKARRKNISLRQKYDNVVEKYSNLCDGYTDLSGKYVDIKARLNRQEVPCENSGCVIDQIEKERDGLRERVSELEKENASLAASVHCHEKKMEWAAELCESGKCDAKKDKADLAAKCERLTEQRNKLANDLIEQRNRVVRVTRRLEDAEKGNAYLRNESKIYSETVVMLTEKIKHLEEQLSESKKESPRFTCYTTGLTAEGFLAMKGRFSQR